ESRHLLIEAEADVPDPGGVVVVNAGGHGFYRVDYEPGLRAELLGELAALAPLERYSVLDDTVALALAGALEAAEVGRVLALLVDAAEEDLAVWQLGGVGLELLSRAVRPDRRPEIASWSASLLLPV